MIKYISQSPFIPVVFSGLVIIIVLLQCFAKRKFLRIQLMLALVLTFGSVLFLVFFNQLTSTEKQIYEILTYIGMLLCEIGSIAIMFTTVDFSITSEKFRRTLTQSLDETKFYVFLDKKERVKNISKCLLDNLLLDESDALNRNFFDVVEARYRIVGLNGEEALKDDVKRFYYKYERRVVEGERTPVEINLQDEHGGESSFYFTETPIFNRGKYVGRILLGELKDEESLVGMEKDLVEAQNTLSLLQSRFTTLLYKTNDGIFFNYVDKKTIWFNDILVDKLSLNGNTLSYEEFYSNMKSDNVALHQAKLSSMQGTDYDITFQYNTGSGYVYVSEVGQKISLNGSLEYCGIMNVRDDFGYEKTKNALDSVATEAELNQTLRNLINDENNVFMVAYFKVSSIPSINEKFGRPIGNTALSEYVALFKKNYVTNNLIFRVSGLEFVAIITNFNRMEALKSALKNEEKILHLSASYANEKIITEVHMGVSYTNDTANRKDVVKNAKDACRIASNPQFKSNYAFYRDIK